MAGRGQIRQRGRSLEVRVYVGMVDGKRRYAHKTVPWQGTPTATKRKANKVLNEVLSKIDEDRLSAEDMTFKVLTERWRRHKRSRWSPTTEAGYESHLHARILPALGQVKIAKITVAQLDAFLGDLAEEGMSKGSIQKIHAILRQALGEAVRWGYISKNPADRVDRSIFASSRKQPDIPTQAELGRLLQAARADDPGFATLLWVAAVTGARRGELCALRWRDIDMEGQRIALTNVVVRGITGHVIRPTLKGGTEDEPRSRVIHVGKRTIKQLAAHRLWCKRRALACGAALTDEAFVFSPDPANERAFRPLSLTQHFRRLREDVGLSPNVKLHSLRHFVGSRLINSGVDVATVAEQLGHRQRSTTLDIYTQIIPDSANAERAAALIEKVVAGARASR